MMGDRAISRVTGLTLVTISRVIGDTILHAGEFNALMAGKAKVGAVELDEMWTFVNKNKKMWTEEKKIQISKAMHGFTQESNEI